MATTDAPPTTFVQSEIARLQGFLAESEAIIAQVRAVEHALAALQGRPLDLGDAVRSPDPASEQAHRELSAEVEQLKISLRTEIDRSATIRRQLHAATETTDTQADELRALRTEVERVQAESTEQLAAEVARVRAEQSGSDPSADGLVKALRATCANLRGEVAQKAEEVTRLTKELESPRKPGSDGGPETPPSPLNPPANAPIVPLRANKAIGRKRYVALPESMVASMQTGDGFVVFMDGPRIVLLPEEAATNPTVEPSSAPKEPERTDEPSGGTPSPQTAPGDAPQDSTPSPSQTVTEDSSPTPVRVERDNRPVAFQKRDEVLRVVREHGPMSGRDVTRALFDEGHMEGNADSHSVQVNKVLHQAQEEGKVLRTGGSRGPSVRWHWVEVTQEQVRDAVVKHLFIEPFSMTALVQKIKLMTTRETTPDAVMPHVERLVERNVLQRTENGRLKYVVPPDNSPRHRPKTPEKLPTVPIQPRGGQAPSGRKKKASDPHTQAILNAAAKQNLKVEYTGSGHIAIHCPEGRIIIPSTPSSHRGMLNDKARLRKAGLQGV